MDTACTEELYEQAKSWLENGQESETPEYYDHLMEDPNAVIDSLVLTFQDAYGTVQVRTPKRLYSKYETIHDGDPPLNPTLYGRALSALADMGLIEHDTSSAYSRWLLDDTVLEQLRAVKEAANDPTIQELYA